MALFKSNTLTQASGSVGGTTYSRTKSGMVMRARSRPTDPASSQQRRRRSASTQANARWVERLTAKQRKEWDVYAKNVAVTNPLGDATFRSGQQWYVGYATLAIGFNGEVQDDAPTVFDVPAISWPILFDMTDPFDYLLVFDGNDPWQVNDDTIMIVYMGRPVSPGRSSFKGPFMQWDSIQGNDNGPPEQITLASQTDFGPKWVTLPGMQIWIALALLYPDGRHRPQTIFGPFQVGQLNLRPGT